MSRHHTSKGLTWGRDDPNTVAQAHHGTYDIMPKRGGSAKLVYSKKVPLGSKPSSDAHQDLGRHRNLADAQAAAEQHHAKMSSVGKGVRVMSIDEYRRVVKGDDPRGKLKRVPRDMSVTSQMRPVSDEEVLAKKRSRADKALSTGYSKVSGGGALKAENRARSRAAKPDFGSDGRLGKRARSAAKAIGVAARPSTVSRDAPAVLAGGGATELSNSQENEMLKAEHGFKTGQLVVHNSSAGSDDHGTIGAVGGRTTATHVHFKTATEKPRMIHHSELRAATSEDVKYHQSKVDKLHGLGFTNTDHLPHHVKKGTSMNFNDLFKAELGPSGDEVLADCPHCHESITRGDLEKAHKAHKGKGKKTDLSGPKHGKSSAHVRDHNPEGGTMRGGDGRGVHTSSRGVPGAKKHDEARIVGGGHKGKLPGVAKADREDDDEVSVADPGDVVSKSDHDDGETEQRPSVVKKSVTIRGTEFVQYIDDGSDAAIAKAIMEGSLGGTPPTQPMDLNHDLTRLLI